MRGTRRNDTSGSGDLHRRQARLLCVLALPFLVALYLVFAVAVARPQSPGRQLRIDEFLAAIQTHDVHGATVLVDDDRITGTYSGGRYWVEFGSGHETLFARLTTALEQGGVPTTVQ